jgi:hypothetical protein
VPFAVAAAGIGAVGAVAGGIMQNQAIKSGQSAANQAIQQGVSTATNQLSPWTTAGQPALTDQSDLLGLNGQPAADAAMAKFQSSPGYQFQLNQGLRTVDAGAAAKGFARSGAALQAEQEFGQGLAASDFGNYWNRLQQLSGSGLTAAGGIAGAATGGASNIAQTDASAATAQSGIYGNEASSLGGTANQLLGNQQFQNYIKGLGGSSGGINQAYNPGFNATPGISAGYAGTFQSGGVF